MAYDTCPNCADPIAPPLSSGRQVCGRCSWVSQTTKAIQHSEIATRDLFLPSVPVAASPTGSRKWLSVLCHASSFLSLIGLAIMILLWQLHPDEVVKKNAKEAINFRLTLWFYIVCLIPIFLLIPTLAVIFFCVIVLGAIILPLVAMLHCLVSHDTPFTYPLILHIL